MGTKTSPHYFYLFDMLPFLINDSTGFSVDQLVNCWEACWSSVVVWWVESYLWWIYSAFSASVHSHQSFYFTNYISAWLLTSWSLPCFPPYFSTLVFSSLILSFFYLIYSLVVLFIISFNHFLSSSISILIYKFLYSSYPPIIPSFLSSFLSSSLPSFLSSFVPSFPPSFPLFTFNRRSWVTNRALVGLSLNATASTLY